MEFYPNREAGGEEQSKDVVKDVQFEHGYRLGFVDNNKVWEEQRLRMETLLRRVLCSTALICLSFFCPSQFYLHNHLSFILYFHREKQEEGEVHNYRVVRFEVVPQSVKAEGWYHQQLLNTNIAFFLFC